MERGLSVVGLHQGFRSCRGFLPYRPVAAHPLCFSGIDEIESVAASCPLPASFAPRTEPLFNLRPLLSGFRGMALPLPIAPPSGRSRNYNSTCTGAWIARLFSVTSQSSARTRTPAACAFWSAWPKAG